METQHSLAKIEKIIEITQPAQTTSFDDIRPQLISLISELISKDFHSLVQLLYRIDVSEKKIRMFLDQNREMDSAELLADLVIERQLQKAKSRQQFRSKSKPQSDEERW